MIQRRNRLSFCQETPHCRLALRQVAPHTLDRHLTLQSLVRGQQHLAHAAFAERVADRVSRCQIDDFHAVVGRTVVSKTDIRECLLIAKALRPRVMLSACERILITEARVVDCHHRPP